MPLTVRPSEDRAPLGGSSASRDPAPNLASARESGPEAPAPSARQMTDDVVKLMPALRGFARALTRNVDEADDLLQEALTRAIANLHQFTPGTNLKAWLFTILRNTHISLSKQRGRERKMMSSTTSEDVGAPAPQGWSVETKALMSALDELPPEQRQVLVLIGALGFSYEECAEICGCKMGTIKSRLNRGRARLAAVMEGEPPPEV
jgi:RNA polymerase sigma-70 factor, ECF subfamily